MHIRNHTLYCKPCSPRNLGRVHLALTGFHRSLYLIKTCHHFCTSMGQTNCFASLTLASHCHCSDTMATWNPIFQDSRSTALVHTGAGRLFQPLSLVDHLKSGDCGWTIRSTTGYWLGLTSIKYPDLITEQQFRTIQGRSSRGNQRSHGHVCVCVCVTPRSTVFLQNLVSPQLLKNCPSHCGIQRFITVFTTARHLSLFWGVAITAILTLSAYYLKIHFNITLTPTPLSFRFTPTKTLYAFTFPPYVPHAPPISNALIW